MALKTTCSKCSKSIEKKRLAKSRYCRACSAEYMRITRKKHGELSSEQRMKANCRSYLNVYIRRGKIERKPCVICSNVAQAHHEDYNKPLDVVWLCTDHHILLHKYKLIPEYTLDEILEFMRNDDTMKH